MSQILSPFIDWYTPSQRELMSENGKTSPSQLCHPLEHYAQGCQGEERAYRRGLLRDMVRSV